MQMTESTIPEWDEDYKGKTVVVASHLLVSRIDQLRPDLRPYGVPVAHGVRVNGFVLGVIVDRSTSEDYWVDFPWSYSSMQVKKDTVIRILLDDEGEPDLVGGLPRLVFSNREED